MIPYSILINKNIPGKTPQEKYENILAMKHFLQIAAYPRRGTKEEQINEYDIASMIQYKFTAEDLSLKDIND